ncbi:hypothetical protein MNBD_NITROSPINAE04-456 [hydrothermal vent metagenome]|uniref:Uncharacterized protein n=1 Tax=hydrothermal vent metagenome TaxID=652676 RepID=A0A3B1CYH8_9ZZZZ
MSIIDDALNRLQEQRSDDDSLKEGEGLPLPKLKNTVGNQKKDRNLSGFAVIAFVAVIVGGVIWVALDMAQERQIEEARSLSAISILAPKPVKTLESPATVLPLSEKSLMEDRAVSVKNETTPEAIVKKVEPVKPIQPPPEEKITTDPEPLSVVKTERVEPVEKEQKTSAKTEKPIELAIVETLPEVTDGDWLAAGEKVLEEDGLLDACAMWEEGLRRIPGNWIVLVAGVFRGPVSAERAYRRVGRENSALIIRREYQGSQAFYVLAAPPLEDVEKVRKSIKRKLGLRSVKGNWASKFAGSANTFIKKPVEVSVKKKTKASVSATKTKIVADKNFKQKKTIKPKKKSAIKRNPLGRISFENERIEQAQKYVEQGAFHDAVEVLQPMFVSPPRRWQLYFLMGTAYLGLGDLGKADSYLIQGIAVDGKQTGLWVQRAVVAQQKGQDEIALRFLYEAERLNSSLPEIQLNKGFSNDKLGRVKEAVKAYRSFLSLSEGNQGFTETRRKILNRLMELGY